MRSHPHERFLGVPADSDALTLLRIQATVVDSKVVEAAVRQCLAMIDRHPGAQSAGAQQVRDAVHRAADEVKSQLNAGKSIVQSAQPAHAKSSRHGAPPRAGAKIAQRPGITLTPFDRQVLGTLVGCGGWNHASRSRLVSIAAAHRVTVQGLLTVMHGLNAYARSGGARLDVSTITAGDRALTPELHRKPPVSMAERLLPELKDPSPAMKVKWSLIFGLFAMVLGAAVIGLVIRNVNRERASEDTTPEMTVVAPPAKASSSSADASELNRDPVTFAQPPTFAVALDEVVPDALVQEAASVPDELRHVAARVHVSDHPAEAVYNDWSVVVDVASRGWLRLDVPLDQEIASAVRNVFVETDEKSAVSDRLLKELAVPVGSIREPIELTRRAWRVHTLAELAQSLRLALAVREGCEQLLTPVLPAGADVRTQTPDAITLAYLEAVAETLVIDLETSEQVYELWELWLAAIARTSAGERMHESILNAATIILQNNTDLSQQSPSVNVLGRLLKETDWRKSGIVRRRIASWFDDVQGISSADLWVVTSILSEQRLANWMSSNLVLPQLANEAHRRRVRDQLLNAWPAPGEPATVDQTMASGGVQVDAELGARWNRLQAELLAVQIVQQPEALAMHLAILTKLNEAATHLQRGDTTAAQNAMTWIDAALANVSADAAVPATTPLGSRSATRFIPNGDVPGQPIGPDGVWAQTYSQAGQSADERIKLLRALRSTAGSDLGPTDAAVFVREVYRGTPVEVRAMAQSVAQTFRTGPILCQQLLDQLPDAVANESTSDFLHQLTMRSLPPARSEHWRIDARLALIDHCLGLMRTDAMHIDRAAEVIVEAIANQGPSGQRDVAQLASAGSASFAAETVRNAWADSVRGIVVAEPVPGDVPTLERRHRTRKRLANGPIQSFLASRIGHLELFAFTLTAEQPPLRITVSNMLTASSVDRAKMTDAFQQAIEVERTFSNMHALRMRTAIANGGGRP